MPSFEIRVTRSFAASHALHLPGGAVEPAHWHGWPVTVRLAADDLDAADCVVDFHEVERQLARVFAPWQGRHLNDCQPFVSGVNPSAERVAEVIAQMLRFEPRVRLISIEVGEAEGCVAVYRPQNVSS